ncbi:hypothetical protein [Legionella yabuuchiae]|uniref:hypothetical protein n=1 Tax=Legionella yabuuchiae TaxID=376727 RepID=UPI001056E1A4|nr:hypothetical protein [Legionella yabuuchiae]
MKANKRPVVLCCLTVLLSNNAFTLPLTPRDEPKADSFYICYEKRCPNNVTMTPVVKYTRYKYIGCVISRLPCHLYHGDKFNPNHGPLKQFQWVNNYPDALNSFYRCAYS